MLLRTPTCSLLKRQDSTWSREASDLGKIYTDIRQIWKSASSVKQRYAAVKPRLEELILTAREISNQRIGSADLYKSTERAGYAAQSAEEYAIAGQYPEALERQASALTQIYNMLASLAEENNRHTASFLVKKGYGYDVSGEVQEGVGTNADQTNLWDKGGPTPDADKTSRPMQNITVDTDAETEFPDLAEKKHKRVHFPPRTD
jgi:hypothetical protein